MQHRDGRCQKRCLGKAGTYMFGRAFDSGINRVQVKCCRISYIARHHRTLKEMDIVHILDDARGIINIGQPRLAIVVRLDINDMNRRPGGAIMHPAARQQQIMLRVLTMQRDVARRLGQHVIDQRPRKAYPAIITSNGTSRRHVTNTGFRCLAEADFLQNLVDGRINGLDGCHIQRSVLATGKTGTYRPQFFSERGGPFHAPRCTPASAPC